MIKRKPRHKVKMADSEFLKPLDITMFGSADDPCFGKSHSPKAKECGRCGDSEVCAIVMAQRASKERKKQEKTHIFKDLEEPNLDLKTLEVFVLKTFAKTNPIRYKTLLSLTIKHFSSFEKTDPGRVDKLLVDYVKRSDKYKKYSKDGKRYLKLITKL